MDDAFSLSLRRPFQKLAVLLALLSTANVAFAQATPGPTPAPAPAAPAPQAAPPAPQSYPAAPPPGQQPYYAPPQNAQQPYAPPPQGYPQPQQGYPQQGYAAPGAYQQPYTTPYSQMSNNGYRGPLRPRRALMITGASILGASYLLSMFVGSIVLDNRDGSWDGDDDGCSDCRAVGRWLFVPVIGPFVAMSQTDDGDPGLWFLGMLQLVGVGLTTGGIIRLQNSKRAMEAQGMSWNLGRDRKLTLDVQSGLRSVGPRMRIDF